MKNLSQGSLHNSFNNKQVIFHEGDSHIKLDIHVKKIYGINAFFTFY